jgi:hypothetical protein
LETNIPQNLPAQFFIAFRVLMFIVEFCDVQELPVVVLVLVFSFLFIVATRGAAFCSDGSFQLLL